MLLELEELAVAPDDEIHVTTHRTLELRARSTLAERSDEPVETLDVAFEDDGPEAGGGVGHDADVVDPQVTQMRRSGLELSDEILRLARFAGKDTTDCVLGSSSSNVGR